MIIIFSEHAFLFEMNEIIQLSHGV